MNRFMEELFGTPSAVKAQQCVAPPFGCGNAIPTAVLQTYSLVDRKEYEMSGMCRDCSTETFDEIRRQEEILNQIENDQVPPDEMPF